MKTQKLLEQILIELQNLHYHMERLEIFTKMAYNIREDKEKGAWVEENKKEIK